MGKTPLNAGSSAAQCASVQSAHRTHRLVRVHPRDNEIATADERSDSRHSQGLSPGDQRIRAEETAPSLRYCSSGHPRVSAKPPTDFAAMSDQSSKAPLPLRHPSAGNVDGRPTLLREGDGPTPLPAASFPHGSEAPVDSVRFAPDVDDSILNRLVGSVGPLEGKRVLDLGCGAGGSSLALARKGAHVIAVEGSTARLTQARAAAEIAQLKVEFHHSDLADLAFQRADSIDLVIAVYSLAGVQDLGRVFRQLHRIMKPEAALVMSVPHPFSLMLELDAEEQSSPYLTRSAWHDQAISWRASGDEGVTHVHQVSDLFTSLIRANFRVDNIVEPIAQTGPNASRPPSVHYSELTDWVPSTLVIRARKEGT